jgi:cytidine deaminase
VHAEQAVVVNAVVHNERGLKRLAVSAPPCGHCRQFLWELHAAHDLQILVVDHPSATLAELLPRPFGPTDLGQTEPLMAHSSCKFLPDMPAEGPVAEAAIAAASASYAPYSQSPAGVGLATTDGVEFRGPYIENAAFNPSLPPMIAAVTMLVLSGRSGAEVSQAALVRLEGTMIDHDATARRILDQLAPGVPLRIISARIAGT